jgi:hypothetical protein
MSFIYFTCIDRPLEPLYCLVFPNFVPLNVQYLTMEE